MIMDRDHLRVEIQSKGFITLSFMVGRRAGLLPGFLSYIPSVFVGAKRQPDRQEQWRRIPHFLVDYFEEEERQQTFATCLSQHVGEHTKSRWTKEYSFLYHPTYDFILQYVSCLKMICQLMLFIPDFGKLCCFSHVHLQICLHFWFRPVCQTFIAGLWTLGQGDLSPSSSLNKPLSCSDCPLSHLDPVLAMERQVCGMLCLMLASAKCPIATLPI